MRNTDEMTIEKTHPTLSELKMVFNNIFSHLMELGFRVEAIGKKVSLDNQDYLSTTGCSILSPTERVLP